MCRCVKLFSKIVVWEIWNLICEGYTHQISSHSSFNNFLFGISGELTHNTSIHDSIDCNVVLFRKTRIASDLMVHMFFFHTSKRLYGKKEIEGSFLDHTFHVLITLQVFIEL